MPAKCRPIAALLILAAMHSFAADWPMWRCDPRHSAATPGELPEALSLQWTLQLPELKPAWPDEPRMRFDVAYEPVIAGQTLFIASPREDALIALDTRTGAVRWATAAMRKNCWLPCNRGAGCWGLMPIRSNSPRPRPGCGRWDILTNH